MHVVRAVHGYHEALKLLVLLVAGLALVFRVFFGVGWPTVARDAAEASPVVRHLGTVAIPLVIEIISAAQVSSERATIERIVEGSTSTALGRFGSLLANYQVVVVDKAVALGSTAHTSPPKLRGTFASTQWHLESRATLLVLVIHRVDEGGTGRVGVVQEIRMGGLGLGAELRAVKHLVVVLVTFESGPRLVVKTMALVH